MSARVWLPCGNIRIGDLIHATAIHIDAPWRRVTYCEPTLVHNDSLIETRHFVTCIRCLGVRSTL